MKKIKTLKTTITLSFALAIFVTGCQKIMDNIHLPGNGDAVLNICQVKTITSDGEYGSNYVFNYNKRGDLESIFPSELQPGNSNIFFIYDNKHRVSQVKHSFGATANTPEFMDAWKVFEYNSANQIIKATTYRNGMNGPDGGIPSSFFSMEIAKFQYDGSNRIAVFSDSTWDGGIFTTETRTSHKYDERGNLTTIIWFYHYKFPWNDFESIRNDPGRIDASEYDNKLNIRRTNKMWMFLEKNYSVNNRFKAETYNSYGLPLTFDSRNVADLYLLGSLRGKATVEYSCK